MIRVVGRNLAEGAGAAIGAGVMLLGGMYASWTALALFLGPLLVGALIGAVFYGAPGQRRIAALEGMAILAIFAWSAGMVVFFVRYVILCAFGLCF